MRLHQKIFFLLTICLFGTSAALADRHYMDTPEQDQNNDQPGATQPNVDSDAEEIAPLTGPRVSRAWRWEFFGTAGYTAQDSARYLPAQVDLDVRPDVSGGVGGGYNIGPYLNLNFDFNLSPAANFQSTYYYGGGTENFRGQFFRGMFNAEFYPLNGPITPVITGGVGFVETSWTGSNFNVDETDFAYCAGGGIRWDINSHWFTKLLYKVTWTRYKGFDDGLRLQSGFLSIGYEF